MNEMGGVVSERLPERERLAAEEGLLDLLSLSEEEAGECQEKVRVGIDKALATALSPHDRGGDRGNSRYFAVV